MMSGATGEDMVTVVRADRTTNEKAYAASMLRRILCEGSVLYGVLRASRRTSRRVVVSVFVVDKAAPHKLTYVSGYVATVLGASMATSPANGFRTDMSMHEIAYHVGRVLWPLGGFLPLQPGDLRREYKADGGHLISGEML